MTIQRHIGVHMSDEEMKTVAPADEVAFRSPVPTQVVSNGEYNPLPQTEDQRKVEASDQGTRRRSGQAPQHGPAPLSGQQRRHGHRVPGDEQGVRPGLGRLRGRGGRHGNVRSTVPRSFPSVHLRRPDPLHPRRLQAGRPAWPDQMGSQRQGQPGHHVGAADSVALQDGQLPEGDLPRQRHQDVAVVGRALRRSVLVAAVQRCDPDRLSRREQDGRRHAACSATR